jgi:hypothetical protein
MSFTPKNSNLKRMKCMNLDPSRSKWGDWAPEGGCPEEVEVSDYVTRVLCHKCTARTVTQDGEYRPHLK